MLTHLVDYIQVLAQYHPSGMDTMSTVRVMDVPIYPPPHLTAVSSSGDSDKESDGNFPTAHPNDMFKPAAHDLSLESNPHHPSRKN